MNNSTINIINSISLIAMGIWGYIDVSSVTALIPAFFGAALILCTNGLKKENKMISHIAVLLTLLILGALLGMRLPKLLDQGGMGLYRVDVPLITTTLYNPTPP